MNIVNKKWGFEQWIHNDEHYCGKKLFIEKDKSIGFHFHRLKLETFFCSENYVRILYYSDPKIDDKLLNLGVTLDQAINVEGISTKFLQAGEIFEIPIGLRHSVRALYNNAIIYEFSTQHFDDDSFRIILPC
jgi:mannose-6-phosphate isomerase-like protein (cupin superfamily)